MTEHTSLVIAPCPFCEGVGTLAYHGQPAAYMFVACSNCGAQGPASYRGLTGAGTWVQPELALEEAICFWNKRFHTEES